MEAYMGAWEDFVRALGEGRIPFTEAEGGAGELDRVCHGLRQLLPWRAGGRA